MLVYISVIKEWAEADFPGQRYGFGSVQPQSAAPNLPRGAKKAIKLSKQYHFPPRFLG